MKFKIPFAGYRYKRGCLCFNCQKYRAARGWKQIT